MAYKKNFKYEKIFYISKSHLPSDNANSIQVAHMVYELSKYCKKIYLYIPFKPERYLFNIFKKTFPYYGIKTPNNLKIKFIKHKEKNAFSFEKKALKSIRFKKEDLLYTRSIYTAYKCIQKNIKTIYESHDAEKDGIQPFFLEFIKRNNDNKKSFIIATNNNIEDFYIKNGLKKERIASIPNAINLDFFCFPPQKRKTPCLNRTHSAKNIVYTGSLKKEKGVLFLATASTFFKNYNFICFGGKKKDVEALKKEHKNKRNIQFYPALPYKYIPSIIQQADILIMPYLKKGDFIYSMSPLKLTEYAFTGKKIICSDLPAIRNIVKDKNFLFFYEPENTESLAKALKNCESENLHEKNKRIEIQSNFAQNHSLSQRVKKILTCSKINH